MFVNLSIAILPIYFILKHTFSKDYPKNQCYVRFKKNKTTKKSLDIPQG